MKKRYSLWTLMAVSFITAAAVTATLAWSGAVRKGQGVDIVRAKSPAFAAERASWFKPESAARPSQPGSFADLAERVQKAVVNISTSKKVRAPQMITPMPHGGPRDPFQDFFDKFFDEGMPRQQTQHSLGSGFIIDKDGTILTNNHVVSQADEIEVVLSDGRKFKAKVVGTDEKSDIAVIKIKAEKDLPFVVLGTSKTMRPGDWVMAIGNPFGLEHTVTVGVISAMGRLIGGGPYAKFIQTDASINPGNSGGPLFNVNGEVIGINTMIYAAGQGIGFAIPVDLATAMVPELISKGSVAHGWLGVAIQEVTPELAKSFGLKEEQKGALITEVYSASPAAQAGFMRGDVIVEFNGEKVEDPYDLSLFVSQTKPETSAKIAALRNGERKEFAVNVGKQEPGKQVGMVPEEKKQEGGKADVLGLVVKSITPRDARELDVPADFKGIVVARVEPGSSVEAADLRAGDILMEINGARIQSADDYAAASGKLKKGDIVRLLIKRGHATVYLAFGL
ncbi:MAG: Do family serine endopeptidase [bacterium]